MANGNIEVAKAFVTIVPSMEGSQATITKELTGVTSEASEKAGSEGGAKFGEKFAGALKGAGASDKEIARQKKVVKNTKKDIENLLKEENKLYKKSLTREQRSKYNMIKKLEEKDYKEAANKKDYYKSNTKMVPFGDPKFLKPGPGHFPQPDLKPSPNPELKPGPKPGEIPTPRPVLPPKEIK